MYEKRRKSLGNKRNDISKMAIREITRMYGDLVESDVSKIFDNEEFGYRKITMERPLRDESGELVLKKGKVRADSSLREIGRASCRERV